MNSRTVVALARFALVASVAVILFLASTDRRIPLIDDIWDKANHAFAFLALALFVDLSFPDGRFGPAKVAALLAFGVLIEAIQHLLPHREASLLDLVADAAGIALYLPLLAVIARHPVLSAARGCPPRAPVPGADPS
ncbi:MAG: VanZ family protein [Burkholderiales bacterium]